MPLVELDFKALEWMTAAWMSQDPVMLQELWDGRDPHTEVANEFFNGKRNPAKIWNFGYIYGRTIYGYMKDPLMPSMSESEWKELLAGYGKKYARLTAWQDENFATVCRTGRLVNPDGRWFQFHLQSRQVRDRGGRKDETGYNRAQVCNYPVQSLATGSIVPLWMVMVCAELKRRKMQSLLVLQVHDSLLFDCPSEEVPMVIAIGKYIAREMPRIYPQYFPQVLNKYPMGVNVPLKAEAKVGPNWAAMVEEPEDYAELLEAA